MVQGRVLAFSAGAASANLRDSQLFFAGGWTLESVKVFVLYSYIECDEERVSEAAFGGERAARSFLWY